MQVLNRTLLIESMNRESKYFDVRNYFETYEGEGGA